MHVRQIKPKLFSASVGYDSARATAANILSFVFSNPDINKQFTDYAEIPKETSHPPLRSPKKQQPVSKGLIQVYSLNLLGPVFSG